LNLASHPMHPLFQLTLAERGKTKRKKEDSHESCSLRGEEGVAIRREQKASLPMLVPCWVPFFINIEKL
jgi:hypothetical protein